MATMREERANFRFLLVAAALLLVAAIVTVTSFASLVKGVFSKETDESVQSTIIYEDGEARSAQLPEPNADSTTTNVTTAFATSALHNASGKIALVDAASFTRPGGAYEDGSFGPEQVLCSESNLYPVLQGIKPLYHSKNRG